MIKDEFPYLVKFFYDYTNGGCAGKHTTIPLLSGNVKSALYKLWFDKNRISLSRTNIFMTKLVDAPGHIFTNKSYLPCLTS